MDFKKSVWSGYRGDCWVTRKGMWKAQIGYAGCTHCLGHFEKELDAAHTYDKAARVNHGDRARCNFNKTGGRTNHKGNKSFGSGYIKFKIMDLQREHEASLEAGGSNPKHKSQPPKRKARAKEAPPKLPKESPFLSLQNKLGMLDVLANVSTMM